MTTPTHYDLKHQNSDRHFFYPHIIHIRCCISVRCTTGCHLTATFNNKLVIMITNPGNVSHLFLYRGSLSKMGILSSAKYLEILGHSAFGQLMNPDHHLLEAPATTALNVTRVLPSSPPSPGHRPRLERAPAATTPTSSFPTPTSPLLPQGAPGSPAAQATDLAVMSALMPLAAPTSEISPRVCTSPLPLHLMPWLPEQPPD